MTQQLEDLTLEQLFAQAEAIGSKYQTPAALAHVREALPEFDHPEIDAAPVRHLIVMINPATEAERSFEVHTASESFCEVYSEICHQKVLRGLVGWRIYETIPLTTSAVPF